MFIITMFKQIDLFFKKNTSIKKVSKKQTVPENKEVVTPNLNLKL